MQANSQPQDGDTSDLWTARKHQLSLQVALSSARMLLALARANRLTRDTEDAARDLWTGYPAAHALLTRHCIDLVPELRLAHTLATEQLIAMVERAGLDGSPVWRAGGLCREMMDRDP